MTPEMAFVNVINVSATAGDIGAISEPLSVANGLGWYGIEGNNCKIEWNEYYDSGEEGAELGGWELYAITVNYTLECPIGPEEEPE
jgi:hypothetical protein